MTYKDPDDARRYSQSHYQDNRAVYIARAKISRAAQKARITQAIRQAKDVPCADCAVKYPYYVMQFDHRGEKNFTIGNFTRDGWSLKHLAAEIALCDVVCANCHAERTHQRAQLEEAS